MWSLDSIDLRMLGALRRLDYRFLYEMPKEELHSPMERYLWIRAAVVLGKYEEARTRLEKVQSLLGVENFFGPFLKLQLSVYTKEALQKDCLELISFKLKVPVSDFFLGEYHFLLGYLYILLDEYRQATRHFKIGSDHLERQGLVGNLAHCLFNLCVCFNHLNDPVAFDEHFRKLEYLERCDPQGAARLPYLRIQIYKHLDREQYSDTLLLLRESLEICESQIRIRDLGELAALGCYIFLKIEDFDGFEKLLLRVEPYRSQFPEMHQKAIEEYTWWSGQCRERLPAIEVLRRIEKWKALQINSVHTLNLRSLLCDQLLRSQSYMELSKLARQSSQLAQRKQQALFLIDFRFYEVVAALRLSQREKAAAVLSMYRGDAEREGAEYRLSLAGDLEEELRRLWPETKPKLLGEFVSLEIDVQSHEVVYNGQTVSLSRKPVIEQFLKVLSRSREMLPIEKTFEQIYRVEYNPLLHERRFNSLIDRTRTLFSDPTLIVRREGYVGLSPACKVSLYHSESIERTIAHRQNQIIKYISTAPQPVTISNLERNFGCSRRTLQFDLKKLLEAELIKSSGGTRTRAYWSAGARK